MIKVAICDDTNHFLLETSQLLKDSHMRHQLEIHLFDTAFDILASIKETEYDIVFMDIELDNNISGLNVADKIKDLHPYTIVVFISCYDTYHTQLVQHEPFRFLTRPISQNMIDEVLYAAYSRIFHYRQNYVFYFKHTEYRVDLRNVKYIYSSHRICTIVEKSSNYNLYKKLDDLELELNAIFPYFIRISKSFFVNFLYISTLTNNEVRLDTGETLSVSRSHYPSASSKFSNMIRSINK